MKTKYRTQGVAENGRTLELSDKKKKKHVSYFIHMHEIFLSVLASRQFLTTFFFFSATTLFGIAKTTKRNRESTTEEEKVLYFQH